MANILDRILAEKANEVALAKRAHPLAEVRRSLANAPSIRDFENALRARVAAGEAAVIAEMKKASPSSGVLREHFDPETIAQSYAASGAACLSVLTDRTFFQGSIEHLQTARTACALPVLRKDFIIDEYQVYESRSMGADCILLIAAALPLAALRRLEDIAREIGMAVLVEVHSRPELETALALSTPLLGINNRDLNTFTVDVKTTLDLLPTVPTDKLVISESGFRDGRDLARLRAQGVHAFLIGETLMRAPDPGAALRHLLDEEEYR